MSLIAVQSNVYQELCNNAVPGTEDADWFAIHKKAAAANRKVNIIKRDCFKRLQALQVADEQVADDPDPSPNPNDQRLDVKTPQSHLATLRRRSLGRGNENPDEQLDVITGTGGGDQEQLDVKTNQTQPVSIAQAARSLDPLNNDHWTSAGLPRMDAIEARIGRNTTRAEVDQAAPGFDREAARNAGSQSLRSAD